MQYPERIKIATDVWIIPCRIDSQGRNYKPLIHPSTSDEDSSTKASKKNWSNEEDLLLSKIVSERGARNWSSVSKEINSLWHNSKPVRIGKQCRERWFNHLNPELLKGQWSEEEDKYIIRKQLDIGNKWSEIAKYLQGRTENQVKNRWKSLKKKEEKQRKKDQRMKKRQKLRISHKNEGNRNFSSSQGFLGEGNGKVEDSSPLLEESESQGHELRKDSLGFMNPGKQEEGSIALRISSLTSDPDLQSGRGFDLNNLYSWSGKIDFDCLYGAKTDQEKTDFDSCMTTYLKAPEQQVWGIDPEGFSSYFFPGVGQGEHEEKNLFEKSFMAGFGAINMYGGSLETDIFNKKK